LKRAFFRNAPLVLLILLALAGILAPWIAPYSPAQEHREEPYHPPTRIHLFGEDGRFEGRPFVYRTRMHFDADYRRVYEEDFSQKYFIRLGRGRILSVPEPGRLHWFGTDSRGRDLFSRILYGARVSMSVGFAGALLATLLGLIVGVLAGYYGGLADEVLMRLAEFFIMIPGFYFLLALRSALPPETDSVTVYFLIVGVLSLIGWGGVARVVRGMTLSVRQNDFVTAARVLGRSDLQILTQHVVPHLAGYLRVVISVSVPSYILAESALSVLGLGIQEPAVSWGNLLSEAISVAHLELHPWVLWPGFFIFMTAFSCNILGDRWRHGREGA